MPRHSSMMILLALATAGCSAPEYRALVDDRLNPVAYLAVEDGRQVDIHGRLVTGGGAGRDVSEALSAFARDAASGMNFPVRPVRPHPSATSTPTAQPARAPAAPQPVAEEPEPVVEEPIPKAEPARPVAEEPVQPAAGPAQPSPSPASRQPAPDPGTVADLVRRRLPELAGETRRGPWEELLTAAAPLAGSTDPAHHLVRARLRLEMCRALLAGPDPGPLGPELDAAEQALIDCAQRSERVTRQWYDLRGDLWKLRSELKSKSGSGR